MNCIPIDPYYLSWKLKTLDYDARFIKLAGEINTSMPMHVIDLISSSLNEYQKSINGSKILVVGVSYKKDIDDCRESPALDIIELLQKSGSYIKYYDPYIPKLSYNDNEFETLQKLDKNVLENFDVCAIITDHSNIDYDMILQHSSLIIDTRNVFKNKNDTKIRRLGEG